MSETEKQEGQKTVVAFIAGLLIGGLLVWVFSSAPDAVPTPTDERTSAVESTDRSTSEVTVRDSAPDVSTVAVAPATPGDGLIVVSNQKAGSAVVLGETSFPSNDGWLAVRDFTGGVDGNILGASRYSLNAGLIPESISLLRATEAGNTYKVVFFGENGDRVFDLEDDSLITGVSDTFTAQ